MTVTLDSPTTSAAIPTPRRSENETPAFIAAIEAQTAPALPRAYGDFRDLTSDEVAIALAASDIETLPEDLLAEMGSNPEVIDVETLSPLRPKLTSLLVGWVAQGMERIGGRHALWVADYTIRFMEDQGYPSWENSLIWGELSRARMVNMLSWEFHFWAGGQEPEVEYVYLWEMGQQGEVRRTRQLRDLRGLERERPYLKLVRSIDGYRWAPAT